MRFCGEAAASSGGLQQTVVCRGKEEVGAFLDKVRFFGKNFVPCGHFCGKDRGLLRITVLFFTDFIEWRDCSLGRVVV